MAIINQPSLLPGEFASDGDKNVIPANNDGLSGLASIAKGFPPITQQPLASGGLPPQRADFNGIFNLISQFLLYSQNGGVFTYSATLDYNPPAMVGDSEGNIYICIAQNGPNTTAGVQATSDASYWVKAINANTLTTILEDYVSSSDLSKYLPLSGGILTGNLNASGYNITASEFIGNLNGNAENDGNGNNIVETYAPLSSPAFSGTPTAPTPAASDNSTKLATTAFVKSLFTASKQENGWWKDGNTGMIWQWGQEANYHDINDSAYGSSGSLNFPISFPNSCLCVVPYLIGDRTSCCVSVSSFTNSEVTVNWEEWSSSVQTVKFGYIAIGY